MASQTHLLLDVADRCDAGNVEFSPQSGGPTLAGAVDWSVRKVRLSGGRSDGIDVVTLNNGCVELDVVPTRGMGLLGGTCRGLRLGWDSPVRLPVHPSLVNLESRGQLGWLDGFNEWLCRCGLAFNGPPGPDDDGTPITLHGRIANLPAHRVELTIDEADGGALILAGVVDETSMFGTNLELRSQVILPAGRPIVRIVDRVTNLGSKPQEYELLYHINQGEPFLDAGARVRTPFREMAPRDARAAEDVDTWDQYAPARSGYAEQVYFFHPMADAAGWSRVLLENPHQNCGLSVRFQTDTLPCLAVWKNTQAKQDGYCTGLEPCTDFPNHRSYERKQDRLRVLEPGQSEQLELEIEIASDAASVARLVDEITALQSLAEPEIHRLPHRKFSAG